VRSCIGPAAGGGPGGLAAVWRPRPAPRARHPGDAHDCPDACPAV